MRKAPRQTSPREPAPALALEATLPVGLVPWLLGGLILALSLWRLVGFDHLLVWHDEVFTLIRVLGRSALTVNQSLFNATPLSPADALALLQGPADTWAATLTALMRHPEHPPLYYLLARALMGLPIDPVTAMRGASAGFGVLLPLAAFWLMQEVFGSSQPQNAWQRPASWPAPWLTALLVAASPLYLLYAQEGRQYALWTLLVAAASAAFLRALRTRDNLNWASYATLLALALYTHLLSALLIPLHALYGLLASNWKFGSKLSSQMDWQLGWQQEVRPLARRFALAVGAAIMLLSPWLVLMIVAADRVDDYTSWMQRPIPLAEMFLAWRDHLTRVFIDIRPVGTTGVGVPPWTALVLVPVGLALGHYLLKAPRPAVWFLPLLALAFIGMVLGPDLLLGGSRSQHPRYALPGLLALELMLAWSLSKMLTGNSTGWRWAGCMLLATLLTAGLWSFAAIGQAESWWNKNFSAGNSALAHDINAAPAPLVAVSPSGVSTGEILSLAYHLAPHVRIWGEPEIDSPLTIPDGFTGYFALTPSAKLRTALKPLSLRPVPGHWQWFQAQPGTMPSDIRNPTPEHPRRAPS
ncbi:glycosyltransferase family 39 protein [Thiorhodovibrio frisius]|uniref:Putative membrane protein n=1 Tax=Thiorhodovibrio frisius TaxID=631362 RepID=H8Z155_9GAMM|nr:glycosyltransferase family 39 protein [Thiorhodovibrio frisius]EIC21370.1 putative membrane protein [Thiorhodovibrio frisius]WPL23956.1 putative membrane protein [Thiorhodovibrio frisius]